MAELRKIVRSNPVSNFQQVAPATGGAFRLLAEAMGTAYKMVEPAALDEMKALGQESADAYIQQNMGGAWKPPAIPAMDGKAGPSGISESADAAMRALQADFGELKVISGYRDPERNARVGGAKNSQHIHGNAFDVDVSGLSQEQRVDLIRRARAAGFSGIGVYNNSLHFDVGGDRAWGPSYKRDSLPAWAAEAVSAPLGARRVAAVSDKGKIGDAGTSDPVVQAPAPVMNADGKTELRLFSPLSGPLLQAHNAAALAAVGAETEVRAQAQLLDLSRQFELDPQGFQQAADSFIRETVKGLPKLLRGDARAALTKMAQSRALGMLDEQHRDTRQRAMNASAALVDRYSGAFADAILSGDEAEIGAARERLDNALAVRERLPGAAWTPEQSENVRLKAVEQAERARVAASREAVAQGKDQLSNVIKAAKDGLHSADEAILTDPAAAAAHPELWREAASWVMLRDTQPELLQMPPGQLAAEVEAIKAQPIQSDFQRGIIGAMETLAQEQKSAFHNDPVARAQKVLPWFDTQIDVSSPEAFGNSLLWRHEQARRLAGIMPDDSRTGPVYTDKPVLLSGDEAKAMATLMGKETPPELRLAYAAAAITSLGRDGTAMLMNQLNMDPVLKMSAMMQAAGGETATATQALRGQTMLDEGLVMRPTKAATLGQISPDMAAALAHVPEKDQGDLLKFAQAIYASDARGIDHTSDEAKVKMSEAMQAALGQRKTARGEVAGGVQTVAGKPVLLPVTVTAGDAENAIRLGLGGGSASGFSIGMWAMSPFSKAEDDPRRPDEAMWRAAGAPSVPMLGGQPVSLSALESGFLSIQPHPYARDWYVMVSAPNGESVTHVRDAAGNTFAFNLPQLVEATR